MAPRLPLPRKKKASNAIDQHVGRRVRMRRIMLAMSQEKLGAELGLTFQQVQKYEKGTNRIAASRLQQISQILQVPVSFFFEGAPNALAPHGSGGGALSKADLSAQAVAAAQRIDRGRTSVSPCAGPLTLPLPRSSSPWVEFVAGRLGLCRKAYRRRDHL